MNVKPHETGSDHTHRKLRTPGVLQVFGSPRALFVSVEHSGGYGWALAALLGLVVLAGYLEVQTGLIDRDVDVRTEERLAKLEAAEAHLLDRVEFRARIEAFRKEGEFEKLLARLGVVVAAPLFLLASVLLIASVFYAAVALTGRKPDYRALVSICVFSAYIELVGLWVRLAMVFFYRTTRVDTSLAMLVDPHTPTPLVAVDVFRIWFWVLVALGLIATRQLRRRAAIIWCTVMAVVAGGAHVGLAYAVMS